MVVAVDINEIISYYRRELKNSPVAIDYIKKRQLTKEIVNNFKVGFAPDPPKYNYIFRNRIMIPIKNSRGEFVSFVGRTIVDEDPKYKNLWETEYYQKGRILFGYSDALPFIKDTAQVFIVEGPFDLFTLWKSNVKNVVACSGTAFTLSQACLLGRYANTIFTAFDSDNAGEKGVLKIRKHFEEIGVGVRIGKLPEGEDPDSFVNKNGISKFMEVFK